MFLGGPIVDTQTIIRLASDVSSTTCELLYFVYTSIEMQEKARETGLSSRISHRALEVLIPSLVYTFSESARFILSLSQVLSQ